MASRANVSRPRGAGQSRSKIGISRAWGSRSRAGVSARASGLAGAGFGGLRVFHNGLDVTPQSLLTPSTGGKSSKGWKRASEDAHVKCPSAGAVTVGGGVASRKKSTQGAGALQSAAGAAAIAITATASPGRGKAGTGGNNSKPFGRRKREGPAVGDLGLAEEDLNAPIVIELRETPTVMLLEVQGSAVATDLRDFGRYQQEKHDYEKRLQERIGGDRSASRHTQTINWALKTKEVTAAAAATKDASCTATTWEIFDEQFKGTDQGVADDGVYGGGTSVGKAEVGGEETAVQRQAIELATVTLASEGCLLETANTVAPPPLPQEAPAETRRGGGGGGISSNAVNPNASRARGINGTGIVAGGCGSVEGYAGGGRKGNSTTAGGKNLHSQSSVGTTVGTTVGTAAGVGGNIMNIDGGELTEEEVESPMDARGVAEVLAAQQAEKIMVSKQLLESLELVERSLVQNFLHNKQLEYRNYPSVASTPLDALSGAGGSGLRSSGAASLGGGGEGLESRRTEVSENVSTPNAKHDDKSAELELLWTHRYPFLEGNASSAFASSDGVVGSSTASAAAAAATTAAGGAKAQATSRAPRSGGVEVGGVGATGRGGLGAVDAPRCDRTVTALCFHQYNGDVLAVGYGTLFFSSPSAQRSGGTVLFWSIRNPEHPERTIRTRSGVTSLDFSERHPNLLAVGMYDGTIAIYDTAREGEHFSVEVAESSTSSGKHTDPVWEVKWVNKGAERGETLVSISTDGRVVEWSMKKGLSFSPLMVLKRVGNTEGVISRQASGLSFDFPRGDGATYFAGTEDGLVHKCSVSYNEQYLETYHGHTGPVYRIRCSPFHDHLFISCSADWTVRLWEESHTAPLHTLRSVDLWDAVNDVAWSPTCATVLASVAGDGRVQLWDLAQSTLDPIVSKGLDYTTVGPDSHLVSADGSVSSAPANRTAVTGGQSPRPRETSEAGRSETDGLSLRSVLNAKSQLGPGAAAGSRSTLPVLRPHGMHQLTAVTFAANAPVLAVGDSRGCVEVYKIVGVDLTPDATREEQVNRLRKAVMADADG